MATSETCRWSGCTEPVHPGWQWVCKTHATWIITWQYNNRYVLASHAKSTNWWGERSDVSLDFRFSASYADRYHNCHGSANLEEAIPGFEHPPKEDNGMKGEGTRLHKIFEEALSDWRSLRVKAQLLRTVAKMHWIERRKMLADKKTYVIWYFLRFKTAPPLSYEVIEQALMHKKRAVDTDGQPAFDPEGNEVWVIAGAPPRRLEFLADALEYIADLIDKMDKETLSVKTELRGKAEWLKTLPGTTADLIIKDKYVFHCLDAKFGDIEVSPIENSQLMYYAWTFGASSYPMASLHILQRGNLDYWDASHAVLKAFVTDVKESEVQILAGDLTLNPGSHCKFCPANPHSRGSRGTKACPAMMTVLYGTREEEMADAQMTEGDLDD